MARTCVSHRIAAFGVAAGAALLTAGAAQAQAQSQSRIEAQADFNTARSDALLGTSISAANPPTFGSLTSFGAIATPDGPAPNPATPTFNFNALGPVEYFRKAGGANPTQEAAETTPELKLGFKYLADMSPAQFSGFLDAASDRYSKDASDGDKFSGNLRMDWVGDSVPFPARGRPIPYISYAPSQAFGPFFKSGGKVTQDFTLGAASFADLDALGQLMDTRAPEIPTWEFGLALSAQRRIVSMGADSTALLLGPSVKWTASSAAFFPRIKPEDLGALSASLALNLTRRFYDKTADASERVWGLQPQFNVAWQLPAKWFGMNATKYGAPELDFQATYNDSNSSVSANNSRQWNVGPSLKAGWTF